MVFLVVLGGKKPYLMAIFLITSSKQHGTEHSSTSNDHADHTVDAIHTYIHVYTIYTVHTHIHVATPVLPHVQWRNPNRSKGRVNVQKEAVIAIYLIKSSGPSLNDV